MKPLVIIAAILASATAQEFIYCEFSDDIYTLWPDWNNFTNFIQCSGIKRYTIHTCKSPLQFNYFWQV